MALKEIIVDADFCIKIGASAKYRYLERLVPILANKSFIHRIAYDEIIIPGCAKEQLDTLIKQRQLEILDENSLTLLENAVYQGVYQSLARIMMNPHNPRKNQGETCSLAIAKTKSISFFVTDEKNLQPIIDKNLNTGIDDIICLRIEDIVRMFLSGELKGFTRKEAKILWRLSGKDSTYFDKHIWPIHE